MIELDRLLAATGGRLHGKAFSQRFSSFSYDSRLLSKRGKDVGSAVAIPPMFVAIKTEKGDGHDYIAEAVSGGAGAVLVQHPVNLEEDRVTCIIVPDTRAALTAYARHVLQRPDLTTVGITGSTGKTTTKELIATVLAQGDHPVFRNRGSINGRYGLSIAAGDLEPHHRLAVLELAADSFDEIRDLATLTQPQVGVVTSVSPVHLATFGSLDAIANEKGRLLEVLPSAGLAILNADDPTVVALADRTRARIITVGTAENADLRATDVTITSHGIKFTLSRFPGLDIAAVRVRSQLLGAHHIPLILSAMAVGWWFGIPLETMVSTLADIEPLPGRLRPLKGLHGALLLDDTVNASPAATRAAMAALSLFEDRLRVAVLGDMWDLGALEASAHSDLGRHVARVADWLVVKGERAQNIAEGAMEAGMPVARVFRAYTDEDILRFLEGLLVKADVSLGDRPPVILVKGDRPARMERIVAGLMDEPARAGSLLVRQSAGWKQVQPLVQDRPTWVEIDLEAIAGNVRASRAMVGPEVGICAVLKADGYGHGAASIARTALNNGARMLAVACLAEAVTLRRAAIDAPILVLGYTPAWQARDTLRHGVTATIYDHDVARALNQAAADLNRPARVHVKVDTGMGRLGLLPERTVPFLKQIRSLSGLIIEGIFTHFSVADSTDPDHEQHTAMQLATFQKILADLGQEGIEFPLIHAANSSAMLTQPASHFNLVRLGMALYGLPPSPGITLPDSFRSALGWKTQVAQVKELPSDSPISYGNTFITSDWTKVAVIPVGYADGFRRAPRHWGHVLVRGQPAPIIGKVTMDQTMLDVTHIRGVRQGDEVVLIGRQDHAEITVDQVAQRLGTINYEVVSEILARVPRIV
ncbi:MAG: alanine racemase [Chloroflexota bacterium]|nr:alanine racemase [Chloroflexota bacterium]